MAKTEELHRPRENWIAARGDIPLDEILRRQVRLRIPEFACASRGRIHRFEKGATDLDLIEQVALAQVYGKPLRAIDPEAAEAWEAFKRASDQGGNASAWMVTAAA